MPSVLPSWPVLHPATGVPVEGVALLTIDRPDALNALDAATMAELVEHLARLDTDGSCRCIVIAGGEGAFAAGADIREMAAMTAVDVRTSGAFERWDAVAAVGTPTIAAVRGFALGGGCELALACDIVIAADDAVFGQPEVALGVMPGVGGTQRLARAVGQAMAMDMILAGRRLTGAEAMTAGLAARAVPSAEVLTLALDVAGKVAAAAPLAVRAARRAVRHAYEQSLERGLAEERRAFADLFETSDRTEGMAAFLEKRSPRWSGR